MASIILGIFVWLDPWLRQTNANELQAQEVVCVDVWIPPRQVLCLSFEEKAATNVCVNLGFGLSWQNMDFEVHSHTKRSCRFTDC